MRHTNILRTVAVCSVQETLLFSKIMLLCFDLKIIPLFTATYPNTETVIILIVIHTVNAQQSKDHGRTNLDPYLLTEDYV